MKPLRIVYVGNFKHPWCTEVHVCRDAEQIPGVAKVVKVQELDASKTLKQAERELVRIEEAVTGWEADLLIYQRTWGLHPDAIDLWRRLETNGCQTASYHLDLYVGLEREATVRDDDPFWMTGTVFTADGDPETQRALEAMGVNHRWLCAGVVSDECVPGTPYANGTWADIAFVGSRPSRYHPEWPWRRQLLEGLQKRYGNAFVMVPHDNQRVHGADLNDLYASVPVIIGDSLALPGRRNYWSDRFYETVGRGGYLIGPDIPGIETQFKSGEHLDLYTIGDLDHVFDLVDYALAHRDEVREIATAGQEHVREHHTYRHRVEQLFTALRLHPGRVTS